MVFSGLILMVIGLSVRFGVGGGTAHWSGLITAAAGLLLVVAGLLRAWRRRNRARLGLTDDVGPDYRTNRGKIFTMVIVLLYLFSPIDLAVLEFLLPVGVVGDTAALSWLVVTTGGELTRHRRARRLRRELTRPR